MVIALIPGVGSVNVVASSYGHPRTDLLDPEGRLLGCHLGGHFVFPICGRSLRVSFPAIPAHHGNRNRDS